MITTLFRGKKNARLMDLWACGSTTVQAKHGFIIITIIDIDGRSGSLHIPPNEVQKFRELVNEAADTEVNDDNDE